MARLIPTSLAFLLASCAPIGARPGDSVQAPPGYEYFCFPFTLEFEDGSASLTARTRELLRAIVDVHYRHYEWNSLLISIEGAPPRKADLGLARRRARAIIEDLARFGMRPDRVRVILDSSGHGQHTLTALIPPEQVRVVRAEEAKGVIFC